MVVLKSQDTLANRWTQGYTENDVYLKGFTLESSTVENVIRCYEKCKANVVCTSINMNLINKTCELKYSTKSRSGPTYITNRQNTIYMEVRDFIGDPGSRPDKPIKSCKWWKAINNQAVSAVYWMTFNESNAKAFQVFCEMNVDGGGWTLVYSYTFTKYHDFMSFSNAVTPIPSWPVDWSPDTWTPMSTTTPLDDSISHSAMNYSLWGKIGSEFLFKSTITNWIACQEGTGSLVNWIAGEITCRVVKDIAPPQPNYKCTQLQEFALRVRMVNLVLLLIP